MSSPLRLESLMPSTTSLLGVIGARTSTIGVVQVAKGWPRNQNNAIINIANYVYYP